MSVGTTYDDAYACALRDNGHVACWGDSGAPSPPRQIFTQVSVGTPADIAGKISPGNTPVACGLRPDGGIICWGGSDPAETNVPAGHFVQVDASGLCGLEDGGSVVCWGDNGKPFTMALAGTFTDVSSDCGVRTSGTIMCWRFDNPTEANPLAGTFTQVSAGFILGPPWASVCGLTTYGSVTCWRDPGLDDAPARTFRQVSDGGDVACGLLQTGKIACWEDEEQNDNQVLTQMPSGRFIQISVGYDGYACALKAGSQAIVCWGEYAFKPPSGAFR